MFSPTQAVVNELPGRLAARGHGEIRVELETGRVVHPVRPEQQERAREVVRHWPPCVSRVGRAEAAPARRAARPPSTRGSDRSAQRAAPQSVASGAGIALDERVLLERRQDTTERTDGQLSDSRQIDQRQPRGTRNGGERLEDRDRLVKNLDHALVSVVTVGRSRQWSTDSHIVRIGASHIVRDLDTG